MNRASRVQASSVVSRNVLTAIIAKVEATEAGMPKVSTKPPSPRPNVTTGVSPVGALASTMTVATASSASTPSTSMLP